MEWLKANMEVLKTRYDEQETFALMGSAEWSETPWVWLSFSKLHLKWIPTDFELSGNF